MPRRVLLGPDQHGRIVHVDVGDEVVVTVGPAWTRPRLRPLGGDPGPVTTPLREVAGQEHSLTLVAVSPGRAGVVATGTGGSLLDLTVAVRAPRGRSRPG